MIHYLPATCPPPARTPALTDLPQEPPYSPPHLSVTGVLGRTRHSVDVAEARTLPGGLRNRLSKRRAWRVVPPAQVRHGAWQSPQVVCSGLWCGRNKPLPLGCPSFQFPPSRAQFNFHRNRLPGVSGVLAGLVQSLVPKVGGAWWRLGLVSSFHHTGQVAEGGAGHCLLSHRQASLQGGRR